MTDLKFYQTATQFQSFDVNKVAEIVAYNEYRSKLFSIKELYEIFDKYRNSEKVKSLFDLNNLTQERALYLRFKYLDKETHPGLMLFPLWFDLQK